MPNEIDQMTEQEFLERVWIATYAAAYVQYPDLRSEGRADSFTLARHARILAGNAVEDLIYTTLLRGELGVIEDFRWLISISRNMAKLRFEKLQEEQQGDGEEDDEG